MESLYPQGQKNMNAASQPKLHTGPREGIQAARPGSVLEVLSCKAEATAQFTLSGT